MPTPAIFSGCTFTIFGVPITLPPITADHVEGIIVPAIAYYANKAGLNTAETDGIDTVFGLWFLSFCADGPSYTAKALTWLQGHMAKGGAPVLPQIGVNVPMPPVVANSTTTERAS